MEKIDVFLSEEDLKNISGGQLIVKELRINDALTTVKLGVEPEREDVDREFVRPVETKTYGSPGINQKTYPGGNQDIL